MTVQPFYSHYTGQPVLAGTAVKNQMYSHLTDMTRDSCRRPLNKQISTVMLNRN